VSELEARFAGSGYGDFKAALADVLVERLEPLRSRFRLLMEDRDEIELILARGAERAAEIADATLAEVKDRIGMLPRASLRAAPR
jgi:tryptophanyl-tRNA synthetase